MNKNHPFFLLINYTHTQLVSLEPTTSSSTLLLKRRKCHLTRAHWLIHNNHQKILILLNFLRRIDDLWNSKDNGNIHIALHITINNPKKDRQTFEFAKVSSLLTASLIKGRWSTRSF